MPNGPSRSENGNIVDLNDARQAKIEERRRRYERIIFKQILGSYCVLEGKGLKAIEVVDVSTDGLSFQLDAHSKHLVEMKIGNTANFRFYFSQDTYLPVSVTIQNKRDCIENGLHYVRFGCAVDRKLQSYEAYTSFVEFLSKYAATSRQDEGDMHIFFT